MFLKSTGQTAAVFVGFVALCVGMTMVVVAITGFVRLGNGALMFLFLAGLALASLGFGWCWLTVEAYNARC